MNFLRRKHPLLYLVVVTQNRMRTLRWTLELCAPYFDKIIVVDGGSDDGTQDMLLRYSDSKVRSVKHPLEDGLWDSVTRTRRALSDDMFSGCIAEQFNVGLSCVPKDAWVLVHDDDELPTAGMLHRLREIVGEGGFELGCFPCCLVVDGVEEFAPEWITLSTQAWLGKEANPFGTKWEPFFRKNLFRRSDDVAVSGITHWGVNHLSGRQMEERRFPYPWRHIKTGEGWVWGDVWAQAIYPAGHGLSASDGEHLKEVFSLSRIATLRDLRRTFRSYDAPRAFLELCCDWKQCLGTAKCRWYQHYYYDEHPELLGEDERIALARDESFLDWANTRRFLHGRTFPLDLLGRLSRLQEAGFYPLSSEVDGGVLNHTGVRVCLDDLARK